MKGVKFCLPFALSAGLALSAHAAQLTYDFTAAGFGDSSNGVGVPFPSISGSFSVNSGVLTSIDLTIASHSYTVANTLSVRSGGITVLGGNGCGSVNCLNWGTNDFWLAFSGRGSSLALLGFNYTVAGVNGFFSAASMTITQRGLESATATAPVTPVIPSSVVTTPVTPSPVPLPGGLGLLASAVAGLGAARRLARK